MKGVRFYEELNHKNRKGEESRGTVVAVFVENGTWSERTGNGELRILYEGIGAVQDYPNCPPASTSVATIYLREECRRIPEARAREIHPALFEWLDTEEE